MTARRHVESRLEYRTSRSVLRVLAGSIAVGLLAAVIAPGASTASPPTAAPGRLVERDCDTAVWLPPTDCYWLEVPERRDVAGAGTIRLWVIVVHGEGPAAELPPVIDLSGGPGDTASTPWVDGSVVLDGDGRTIVVMDQRGTGRSQPRLDCDFESAPPSTTPWPDRVTAHRLQVVACRDRLVAGGVDLDGYYSVESAADFVDLRRALGVEELLLRGYSYGGRLAREIYRQDPDGVAGLLLDSPLTTASQGAASMIERGDDALARLDAWCDEQPGCGDAGTPSENLAAAAEWLEAEPYGLANGLLVDAGVLYEGVFLAMYRTDLLAALPAAVASLANRDTAVLDAFGSELLPTFDDPRDAFADGLYEVVTCAEDSPAATEADRVALAQPGIWEDLVLDRVSCDLWDVEPVSGGQLQTVGGDLPVFVLSGALDPITPPHFADEVTDGFPFSTAVVIPDSGHGVAWETPCTQLLSLAYTAHPDDPLDTACIGEL
jgi:pimeloyl-ACP methyl ester carboxylesterase